MSAPMSTDPYPTAPRPTTSAWEDVLDIFYAPRAVFERRRDGKYWVALLVLGIGSGLAYFLAQQLNDAVQEGEMARLIRTGQLTAAQVEQGKPLTDKLRTFLPFLLPVLVAIGAWVNGFIIWLLARFMGGKLQYGQATAIAVLASLPELLGRVFIGVQSLFLDTSAVAHKYSFSLNAARFMSGDAGNWMLKLGALADPFVVWGLVLVGMGAWIIGGMEKEKAAVLAIVVGLIGMALFR
jgi:hypothetical protein